MKIQIIGAGRLGSQIAFCCMIFLKPEIISLHDIKDLEGDIMDLVHAKNGYNSIHEEKLKTEINSEIIEADFIVIAAGETRNDGRKHEKWLEINKKLLKNIMKEIKASATSRIIVTTNPVIEITEWAKKEYPQYDFHHSEDELLKYRDGKELGIEILKTKGYTNFGPAMSVVEKIKELSK